jgi:mitochondrial fission protein ELM1
MVGKSSKLVLKTLAIKCLALVPCYWLQGYCLVIANQKLPSITLCPGVKKKVFIVVVYLPKNQLG